MRIVVRTAAAALVALCATAGSAYADADITDADGTRRETIAAATALASDDSMGGGAAPGQVIATSPPSEPRWDFGVGYLRGTGLGNFGVSAAMAWMRRVTPQLHVFGFFDDGSRGFAVVPALKLTSREATRSTAFVTFGVQYMRMWFGDATGGGFGGYGTIGYSFRFGPGFELELGVGLHGKPTIRGTDGVVSVVQQSTFGVHLDAGLRYWF
ncbi:MAG TPA: hypothetical protein VIV11_00625 [Kofleriaceae bacterium]